jgi:AcrR family transcriptional regulator
MIAPRPNLLAGEDLLPVPLQKRSREKRERLKAAGVSLFSEKGYEGTSIDEIAVRADLAVGTFYQHFRSKKQLLLSLMDELLEYLSQLDLRPNVKAGIRAGLRGLLVRALSTDLRYLGVYRAWQEALASDSELERKEHEIRAWTTARVFVAFTMLEQLPGARRGVDLQGLAQVMDSFFWNFLARAESLSKAELNRWIDSATHLLYHALFRDRASGRAGDSA